MIKTNITLKMLSKKILHLYIVKLFLKRFLSIIFISFLLYFLIEIVITKEVNFFDIFINFQNLFRFVFFVSSSWCIISFYKTGEFVAFQSSGLSPFKISALFSIFTAIFSLFYLFIYNGILLKSLSLKLSFNNSALSQFSIYNQFDACNYELILLDSLTFNEKEDTFTFLSGDLFSFAKCKLNFHKTLKEDEVRQANSGIELRQNEVKIIYNYDVFKKAFKEQVREKSFKTFYEKITLSREFAKNNISNHKLLVEVFFMIENIISFFYMTLLPFLFFAKLPPRSTVILRFFMALSIVAVIYMVNLILNSSISQMDFINPILSLIAPSLILCFIYLAMILQKL